MNHTPGPWIVRERWYIGREDTGTFAEVKCCRGIPATAEDVHEANARLIAAAPDLFKACESVLAWLTNCNVSDPATLGREIMLALEKAGADKQTLDDAAIAIVRGPCSVPNLMGVD